MWGRLQKREEDGYTGRACQLVADGKFAASGAEGFYSPNIALALAAIIVILAMSF